MQIIMLVAMFALFYFMLIRPENKRKKAAEQMRNSLKKGDHIVTIGGVMGKIVQVGNASIVIETSEDRVRMEFAKWAVQSVDSAEKKEKKEEPVAEEAKPAESADEAPAVEAEKKPEEKDDSEAEAK